MSSAPGTMAPSGAHAQDHSHSSVGSVSKYMSFMIDGRTYAVALSHVAEITPYAELNQMPHTPVCVEGLLDLRGHVLPVVSLRTKMGLPKKESRETDTILILTHDDSRIGVLVDQIESVITANHDEQVPVSSLLEGSDGTWVREILLLNGKVILVLEPSSLVRISQHEAPSDASKELASIQLNDIELQLDEGLRKLISLASTKDEGGRSNVIPEVKSIIGHTESEMTKVIDSVESMLASADAAFGGLGRFKQEVAISGMKGFDAKMSELDTVTQEVQDSIFNLIQQLQFQDIVRQRLEKVLHHIVGMHGVISKGLN